MNIKSIRKLWIGPSILSADFANLYKQCSEVLQYGANTIHVDIMDGHFVPNLTIGAPVVACLRKSLPNVHLDCHLMVTNPQQYINSFEKAGANTFTFHYQSTYKNIDQTIRRAKMEVGLCLKPKTQINQQIQRVIKQKKVDKLLIMTVEPGFGGQKFMAQMMKKVQYIHQKYPDFDIQVDGGVGVQNAQLVAKSGANWLVGGSSIFGASNRKEAVEKIIQNGNRGLISS